MKKQIHPPDCGSQRIDLLTINRHVSPLLFLSLQICNGRNQHSPAAAGRVVDRLSRFWFQHLRHQMYHRSVGIKLLGRMAAVIRKLFNQILIALPQLIFRAVPNRQGFCAEMFQQIFQKTIRKPFFIGPCAISENPLQLIRISSLDLPESLHNRHSHIFRHIAHILPMSPFRHKKSMVFLPLQGFRISIVFLQNLSALLIIYITDPFKKQQRKDILFIGSRINAGPQ